MCRQQVLKRNIFESGLFSCRWIFTCYYFASIIFVSKDKIFFNADLITLFWECKDITSFINVKKIRNIIIINKRQPSLIFNMFSMFITTIMISISIRGIWSLIMRFLSNVLWFWLLYRFRNILCRWRQHFRKIIPWMLFLWSHNKIWLWVTCWS